MQSEKLDKAGSDCGATKTVTVKLTEKNKKDFVYRYIVEKGQLVELTPEELNKRVNTIVQLRTPMYCLGKDVCNICAGNMNYKLGNTNIGLGCSRIANALLKLGMKKFHIANLKSKQIDPDDMLL